MNHVKDICFGLCAAILFAAQTGAAVIPEVRAAVARGDFAGAERTVAAYRAQQGATPELAEAVSWLARGELEKGRPEAAEHYAAETRRLVLDLLKGRSPDAERHLATALGAAIEVHAQALARRGRASEAVPFLRSELARWGNTGFATRIQKNINMLSLAGKPAPPLDLERWIGTKPVPLSRLRGHAVLLFFWAHWCPDCKAAVPALAKLMERFGREGLTLIAPTQLYGYTARGEEAGPEREITYIDEVFHKYYGPLAGTTIPVSAANFRSYGASTTPTLVLLDRAGIVRSYQPGMLPYEDLTAQVARVLRRPRD